MRSPNLLARAFTSAVYRAEAFARATNIAGAAHTALSRQNLRRHLDKIDPKAPTSIWKAFLTGALIGRDGLAVITVPLDCVFGTGRTHFEPGERPDPPKGVSPFAHEVSIYKSAFLDALLERTSHSQRIDWLKNRVAQSLEHPCDTGLLGLVAGALTLPVLFVSSGLTAAIGALIGCVVYAVNTCAGNKTLSFYETINNSDSWFTDIAPLVIQNYLPKISLTFHMATRIGRLTFDVADPLTVFLCLQGARLATAGVKLAGIAVGGGIGAVIGVGLVTQRLIAEKAASSGKHVTHLSTALDHGSLAPRLL